MDRDANYVAVGAFVILVLAMATVFVLWYSNTHERREYQRYEVYFWGSVSGLTEGSTVRYLGVTVGRVARIRLDPRAADRVEVVIDLDKATPVTDSTLARLTMQGVTGLLFIDLSQATTRGMPAENPLVPGQQYPVIRSVRSDFDLFVAGLPELVTDATRATMRLNSLLGDDNLASIRTALANFKAASEPLPAAARYAQRAIAELHATIDEANRVADSANKLMAQAGPELGAAAAHLKDGAEHLAQLAARLDALAARHEKDLDRFAGPGLAELEGLLHDSRDAAHELRELARSLRQQPSKLLYEPRTPGVEIPR